MACSLTTALHMNLQDLTLTHNKRLKRVAAERDDAYRTEWILNMTMNYTTDQLVFLDKYNKDERVALRRYGQGAALFSHSRETTPILSCPTTKPPIQRQCSRLRLTWRLCPCYCQCSPHPTPLFHHRQLENLRNYHRSHLLQSMTFCKID